MLSKKEIQEMHELKANLNSVIDEKALIEKELEVLKEEKEIQISEFNTRCRFVEGLLSHMLAKPIRIVHQDGSVEHRWQPVSSLVHEQPYHPRGL